MSDPSAGTSLPVRPPEDRLDSWKEIAAYLNRDVTTVQRWEKKEGMPVHRHLHDRMGSISASRKELDAWSRTRKLVPVKANEHQIHEESVATAPGPAERSFFSTRRLLFALILTAAGLALAASLWLRQSEYFWKSSIGDARFQTITEAGGVELAATVSRDGHFVAFLSDRDGQMDVWVTQIGSGEFHNLTHGTAPGLVNPAVRNLGFSPDGSFVTFWSRRGERSSDIGIWAVPTLGGEPRPYLEGVSELDWSGNGSRLAYHTPAPGDPLFISEGSLQSGAPPIFTAPAGLHSHFPLWSPDEKFIYVVEGSLPDKLDIWRIPSGGGNPEQITKHNSRVTHPVFLDRRTLLYLAGDSDGSGPWLYSIDVERRIAHRLSFGPERYSSLAASADGRHLVGTVSTQQRTLWRLQIADKQASPTPISLTTSTAFAPRLGPDYLLYVSTNGVNQSIWKLANGTPTELWRGEGARILGGPAISHDGAWIAFSAKKDGQALLYVMRADGTNARVLTKSLDLQSAPAWAPDGKSLVFAANEHGEPHLFRVALDGQLPVSLIREYSTDPAWAPDGSFAVYSGPDIGTAFSLKAVTADGNPHPFPQLTLSRGARHLAFLPGGQSLLLLRGDLQHKNVWAVDLKTGAERQLTDVAPDFDIYDFDLSPDGRQVVLERVEERSDVVLLDLSPK
jgi:Tol biopolymer transport system component